MFSSFDFSEAPEKLADPVQMSGSSERGSISKNLVWIKKTNPHRKHSAQVSLRILMPLDEFDQVQLARLMCGRAQDIENRVGVICDSPRQVEQVITLRHDFKAAVAEINALNKMRVCEILNVAFLVGGIVAEASNDEGTWQIRRVLIVGLYLGRIMSSVQPYEKYSAFLTSEAAPI
jgi:hypothetical protein